MARLKLLMAAIAACLFMLPSSVFGDEILVNGNFETGDLTGWTFNTINTVVSGADVLHGVAPFGNYMAIMSPFGVLNAALGQEVSTEGYKDATVSFQYYLWSLDLRPESNPDLFAFFAIGVGGVYLDVIPINDEAGLPATRTGWVEYSRTFTNLPQGDFFVGFGLANGGIIDIFAPGLIPGDIGADTVAYVDNVSIDATPVPEPSVLLLLGAGILGLAVALRAVRRSGPTRRR